MRQKIRTANLELPAARSETAEHPGILLLEEFLKPNNLTQGAFAIHIGVSPMTISELVRGKRSINFKLALLLSRALKTTPDFWINAQASHDYGVEMRRLRRSGELQKIEAVIPIVVS